MAKKKKRQIPLIIQKKIDHISKSNIEVTHKNNMITISLYDHEIHQYLRHRTGRFSVYDPLDKYKKELEKRFKSIIYEDKKLSKLIEKYKGNPVSTKLAVFTKPNKSDSLKGIFYKLQGLIHKIKTPDIDNYQKTIFDVANEIFWIDDAQIFECTARKEYSTSNFTVFFIRYEDTNDELTTGRLKEDEYKDNIDLYNLAKDIKNGKENDEIE